MENKIKLSIIIPCYNCAEVIKKCLDSIVNNDLSKEEMQIIIVDDKSKDNSLKIIKTYEDKLNITYAETTREIHCPGNTRNIGIPLIKGEWITFIDNDDTFKPNIFKKVFQNIEKNHIKYVYATQIDRMYLDGTTKILELDGTNGWVHGKFYHTENVIRRFNITFKTDMIGQEDIYFNSLIKAYLYTINQEYFYDNSICTYEWREYDKSFTKITYSQNWNYTDVYMKDYIFATADPYLTLYSNDLNEEIQNKFINIIMTGFLFSYFYYQGSLNRVGTNIAFQNLQHIHNFKERIKQVLNCDEADIINYIYSRPDIYEDIRKTANYSNGSFIEVQSFRDFVFNL